MQYIEVDSDYSLTSEVNYIEFGVGTHYSLERLYFSFEFSLLFIILR